MRNVWHRFKYWFLEKQHPHDRMRWGRLLKDGLLLVFFVVLSALIYQNVELFQEYTLIFLKLPSVALLVSLFFTVKYVLKVMRNIKYGIQGLNNGTKTILLILVILLLFYTYKNQQQYLPVVKETLDEIHFDYLTPIKLNEVSSSWEKSDLNPKNVENKDVSQISPIQNLLYSAPEREEESKKAFDYVNEQRVKYQKRQITWDDRAYKLAVARSKDMVERNYFDHTTHDGQCANTMKSQYGFRANEILAENIGEMTHDDSGNPISSTSVKEAVDGWLESRGHRYNLLYDDHTSGAIGCYKAICIFLGVHPGPDGLGAGPCTTGAQGLQYWDSVPKQPGEV